ncbi:DUF4352 domain-containing protein [Arthrobacter sp. Z1-15]
MNAMKKSLTMLALAGLLGMTACSTDATKEASAPSSPPAATSEAKESATATSDPKKSASATPSQSPSASSDASDASDEVAEFGEEWTYDDGISVNIAYTGGKTASQYASGAEATANQVRLFDVSVTNNSKEVFDPAMFNVDVNYGAEGTAAKRVFDSGSGLDGQFQGKVLPGGTQKVTMAFAVPIDGPLDLLVTTSPSWDHDEKLYFGEAVQP